MSFLKPPEPDPAIERFRDGLARLSREGQFAGHAATHLTTLWSPSRPLQRQWWVWTIVVWADGTRERPIEDYPPWTLVTEMNDGYLDWDEWTPRGGRYTVEWVPDEEAARIRQQLAITADDF